MRKRACAVLFAALSLFAASCNDNARGVRLPTNVVDVASRTFNPTQSAALFVGVREFSVDKEINEVPYAVDDAVDLAYAFALDAHVGLVPPRNVVLALSGSPQKQESKARLTALENAGANVIRHARLTDIMQLLQQQAKLAGRDGVLVVSFATHGFTRDGAAQLLTESSMADFPETALSVARVLDLAGDTDAQRSLLLFDACRERIAGSRALGPDPTTAAPLLDAMKLVQGQVAFYAAAAGQYTWDDPVRRNGVFTGAIIDGLQCGASNNHIVTAQTLKDFADHKILAWIRAHKDRNAVRAIQMSFDGDGLQMPLALCGTAPPVNDLIAKPIANVSVAGSVLTMLAADGSVVKRIDVRQPIAQAIAANGSAVVALTRSLVAFDAYGHQLWTSDLSAGGMHVRSLFAAKLFREATRELVAISDNATSSRVAVFRGDGAAIGTYTHRDHIEQIVVDRQTARHRPMLIVASRRSLVLLDRKNVEPLWYGEIGEPITKLAVVDTNGDGLRDIAVTTAAGTVHLNFDGHAIPGPGPHPRFELMDRPTIARK